MNRTKTISHFPRYFFILIYLVLCAPAEAQFVFHEHASLPEPGRDDAVCFILNNQVYVTGGGGDGFLIQPDLWRYDPISDSWLALEDFPGLPRQYAYANTLGGKAYLIGGLTTSGEPLNELWEYDPAIDHWTEKSSLPGPARFKAVGFVIGNSLYYGTGTNGSLVFKDFWRYDVASDQWTFLPDITGQGRHECIAFAHESQAYIGGGIDFSGNHSSDLFHWNREQHTWNQLTDMPFSIAYAEAACARGFCAIWDGLVNEEFSGEIQQPVFEAYVLDPVSDFRSFSIPGVPLRNTSVCSKGNIIYRFGGKDSTQQKYSTLISMTWEQEVELIVYPNPSRGEIHISTSIPWTRLRILDATGTLVYALESDELLVSRDLRIDLFLQGPGLYFLLVDNITPKRFIFSP
jgi:hypothetical protein